MGKPDKGILMLLGKKGSDDEGDEPESEGSDDFEAVSEKILSAAGIDPKDVDVKAFSEALRSFVDMCQE